MERRKRLGGNGGLEETTMAILDTSGFNHSKMSLHLNDDRLSFLEAVRTASLLPDNGTAPTRKMFDAIFRILKEVDSLDLIVESYQLLIELDKRYPRLYLSEGEQSKTSSSSEVFPQFVMVEEAWLPFNFGMDGYSEKEQASRHTRNSLDSLGFQALIQGLANSEEVDISFLKNMLMLQYLITVLEGDFWPRKCNEGNGKWILLRESLLNMLLGSRKTIYKGLMKDCLSIMCRFSQSIGEENSSLGLSNETSIATAIALPEVKKSTCTLLKKFFVMIMELDSSRRMADQQGLTTRADGLRTPVVEIILEELTYDNKILSAFLLVFDEPKWKTEIILLYFQKYISKATVQTRKSNNSINLESLDGVLKCLSNKNSIRNIIKKISTNVVQLLLAHAFQAYVVQSYEHVSDGSANSMEDVRSSSIIDVCQNFITVFTCLRQEDKHTEILPIGKGALFTAATIISTKS